MHLGKVVGTVVSTRKDEELEGLKLLVVRDVDPALEPAGAPIVAADSVGAGIGEYVLYASGSSARLTSVTRDRPIDATIMAIVDIVELGGEVRYRKDG